MGRRSSLAILLFFVALPAHADQNCAGLYQDMADSAFVRKESGRALDPVYKANMIHVMRSFAGALDSEKPIEDFRAFLRDEHKFAVLGEKPGTFYWPSTLTLRNGTEVPSHLGQAEEYAGSFRNERFDLPSDRELVQELQISAEATADIARYSAGRKPRSVSMSGIPYQYFFPQIAGIPAEASPRYSNKFGSQVAFSYPPSRFVPLYVKEMEKSFTAVREGLRAEPRDNAKILSDLARYYHMIVVGHPFMRVNNSMAMGQVNVVLQKLGMKPVPHGDLDYVLRALDSEEARKAFVDHVMKFQ